MLVSVMRMLYKAASHLGVARRSKRHRGDLVRWLLRRPQLGLVIAAHEAALMGSNRLPSSLQSLITLRAASLVD